jgi:hypothetical protein
MRQPADVPSGSEDQAPARLKRQVSRRALVRGGGLAGMALLLSACSAPAP